MYVRYIALRSVGSYRFKKSKALGIKVANVPPRTPIFCREHAAALLVQMKR
jgi:hypothetical protein